MPLSLHDQSSSKRTAEREPILHTPQELSPTVRRTVFIGFSIAVLGAIVFLLYVTHIFESRQSSQPATVVQTPETSPEKSTGILQASPTSTTPGPGNGSFTIYIASHFHRADAEEEVARWNEAGYQASVVEHSGWSRVALGHYETVAKARTDAEQLKEAFENGYWIGIP